MALILSIESTTKVCSVALHRDGKLLELQESLDDDYAHAEKLNVYIEQAMKKSGTSPSELDAVAIARGPGSYTGLRIGASSAKGLCYAVNKPLIAVDPLKALALRAVNENKANEADLIFSMIDARRDEVFMAVFDTSLGQVEQTSAQIIDAEFFKKYGEKCCLLVGDGAAKFNALFEADPLVKVVSDCLASARETGILATEKFRESQFEDLAYYEPFYGKEFKTTVSKKLSNIHTSNS